MTVYDDAARFTYAYLNQGDVWFPKGKPRVAIADMDLEWRHNAARFLQRSAASLALRYTWGEAIALNQPRWQAVGGGEVPRGPTLSEFDLMNDSVADGWEMAVDARDFDPFTWLRDTKLYRALIADLPTDLYELRQLSDRAQHWSTCPERLNAGLCRCDEIRSAHEAAGAE